MSGDIIIGTVNNGSVGVADFPFYKGSVGIRAKTDAVEIAYFGKPPAAFANPIDGQLDGVPYRVLSFKARDMDGVTMARVTPERAVTLTAIPIQSPEVEA